MLNLDDGTSFVLFVPFDIRVRTRSRKWYDEQPENSSTLILFSLINQKLYWGPNQELGTSETAIFWNHPFSDVHATEHRSETSRKKKHCTR
jgi:hypothetical protein